jgi:hypothetical protein
MKKLTCALSAFLLLLSFAAFSQDNCVNITPFVTGKLTFQVNDLQKNKEKVYPTWYKIKVFKSKELVKLIKLKKGTTETVEYTIDVKDADKYCVQISRNAFIKIVYKKIGWTEQHTVSLMPDSKVYYASTEKFAPFVRRVTSKDGAKGDGVTVLID